MALDGIFLYSIVDELKNTILNCKIDKVNQPEKDEIILTIRANRKNIKLLISASSSYPRIHFTDMTKTNPLKAPMFCMVLRKYLSNAKIINIYQKDMDRIVCIDVESTDELGFNSVYTLIIEIMGRHSNISLVRKRDNVIVDSIKHISSDVNSYRCLLPNLEYICPPPSTKLNPLEFSFEEFIQFKNNITDISEKVFCSIFTGISPIYSKHLLNEIQNANIDDIFTKESYSILNKEFNKLTNKEFSFNSFSINGNIKYFYSLYINYLSNCQITSFESPSKLLERFYKAKDIADRLHSKSYDMQKLINNNIDRCNKKLKILYSTLEDCKEKESIKIQGELLTSNIYSIKKGDKEATVFNYYNETGDEYLTISLDENLTPSENIQLLFKKYTKLKKSEEAAKEQIDFCEIELEYLNSVLTNILNSQSYEEIEEIRTELVSSGYIRFKKTGKSKEKPLKPLHFVSKDGIDIYVGRNNIQNDYLTTKFANKNDTWLHTKNIPGSHVIITGTNIPDSTLLEAAELAAYYSKARNSSKVAVDYTQVRNVKKPSGSKPGMVIYYTNKTIYVDPKERV